jgi:hypothetical protein
MSGPEGTTHGALAAASDAIDPPVETVDTVLVSGYPPDIQPGDYIRMATIGDPQLRWQRIDGTQDVFGTQTKVLFHRPGETRPGRVGAYMLDNSYRVQIARPVAASDDTRMRGGLWRRALRAARTWWRGSE